MAKFALKYINEGKQAEEYKAKKEREKQDQVDTEYKRQLNRATAGGRYTTKDPKNKKTVDAYKPYSLVDKNHNENRKNNPEGFKKAQKDMKSFMDNEKKDKDRESKANTIAGREAEKRRVPYVDSDPINRHLRKQEKKCK